MKTPEHWDDAEFARAQALAVRIRQAAPTRAPIFAVRAPGRVNLIGEHTDYSGLPVLPIAIDRSTIIVAAARDDAAIEVDNADAAYPPRSFLVESKILPFQTGDWANYVKAAVQGVVDHFTARGVPIDRLRGANFSVDGRVPPATGLSSSAALTVASALAFMAVNGLAQEALETAQMVARSEWYVGTMAGGMDQAVSMLGQRGRALLIRFDPLTATAVAMPPGAAVIVADSLEVADKSGRVREEYNRRVVECSMAARILGKARGIARAQILGDVVKNSGDWNARDLIDTLAASAPARISIIDAARILDTSEQSIRDELRVPIDENRPLEILRRARHVLTETQRVLRAAEALAAGNLEEVGELMNASHRSLRDDFDASTARLDAMAEIARVGGALGARLTGAGFGGCIIALAHESDAPGILARLERDYYATLDSKAAARALRTVVHAAAGANVIRL